MNPLEEIIRAEIEKSGRITFRDFMELALYHPQYGYYSRGPRIGREGDFFTSSSVGSIFGRALAFAFKEMLDASRARWVVEMGAGEGHLARDILEEFGRQGWEVEYLIVEKSPALRDRQLQLLRGFPVSHGELGGFVVSGVFFCNELVDAFPVHVVEKRGGSLHEVYVKWEDGFREELGEPSTEELEAFFELQGVELPEGFRTEVNLDMFRWLDGVGKSMERGFLVVVDYGYTAREFYTFPRSRGTLMCYYRHQALEDPFVRVGEQDITSHVNFTALARYAESIGFSVVGFTNQVNFLIDVGILDMVREPRELMQLKTLLLPGAGMGERFKVLILSKNVEKTELRCLRNAPKRESFAL